MKKSTLRRERRNEWKASRHEFDNKQDWYKSWENYKIKK